MPKLAANEWTLGLNCQPATSGHALQVRPVIAERCCARLLNPVQAAVDGFFRQLELICEWTLGVESGH